jgi:hypothetical protein
MTQELKNARLAAACVALCVIVPVIGQPVAAPPRCMYTIIRPEKETQLDDACARYSRCSLPEECRLVISGPSGDVRSCGDPGPVLKICVYYRMGRWNPFTQQCEDGTIEYSELSGYVSGFPNWVSCVPI